MYLRHRHKIAICLLLLTPFIVRRIYDRFWDPSLRLTFFDVGQGDSALVQFPFGKTMLIDGGGGFGKWNAGSRVVFPELARLGVLHLDYLLMSHPDNDHARGLLGILKDIQVTQFWTNACFLKDNKNELLREIRALSAKNRVVERPFEKNTDLDINGVQLRLYPLASSKSESDTNNRTLVLRLKFAGCSILFTGDIEKESEEKIIKQEIGKITLLKVPHHGSKTSSIPEFLQLLSPRWAIISAGIANHYGHPHPMIMGRYHEKRIQTLRTDFHGAIRFRISPRGQIECETVKGSCGIGFCPTH